MKKFLISAIVIVALVLIGVLAFGDDDASYVSDIEQNVVELEAELSDVEELIADDELSEEAATEAYQRVVERVASIEASVETSQMDTTLSSEQKEQLVDALARFKEAVLNFSSTLNVLEETADIDTVVANVGDRIEMNPGSSITNRLASTIDAIEEHIDEAIESLELADLVDADTYEEITGEEVPAATSSDEELDDDQTPMMEDGTLDDEEMSTSSDDSEESTSTEETN